MNIIVNDSALLLERQQTIELVDAAGSTAALDKGCLWITMDGDQRDIVLCTGQSWTIERNGRTLVHAGERSKVRITAPEHPGAWRAHREAWSAFVAKWFERRYAAAHMSQYY